MRFNSIMNSAMNRRRRS